MIYTQNGPSSHGTHIGSPMPKLQDPLHLSMEDILAIIEEQTRNTTRHISAMQPMYNQTK